MSDSHPPAWTGLALQEPAFINEDVWVETFSSQSPSNASKPSPTRLFQIIVKRKPYASSSRAKRNPFRQHKRKRFLAEPLLLTHGWPGSFHEFLDVIGPLVDPTSFGGSAEDAFHVVIPSLPEFGFSDKPAEQGWNTARIARAWASLMQRLGYRRWVAQGGDWGAGITRELAVARPEGLVAAHVNFAYFVFRAEHPTNPTPAEIKAYADAVRFEQDGAGYFSLLATRPQTIGYALADSPVGQATWIYEKFQA
jgi:pimeloyl-ACP methyl ester carboxylesterase